MKRFRLKTTIEKICIKYGYTRQAYYKSIKKTEREEKLEKKVLNKVNEIRIRQPRVGGRKIHNMINIENKKVIGRDKLFNILRENDLLVKKKKKYVSTTESRHYFYTYDNKLKNIDIDKIKPGEVVASDITYIATDEGFKYLSLITDIGSRNIIGYCLNNNLTVEGPLKALEMALKKLNKTENVIHHSDRGIQYCCKAYIKKLKKNNMQISMTEENHCYENSIAERVNGILKDEFLLDGILSAEYADKMVEQAIKIYNEERLHMALNYKTPLEVFNEKVA